MAPSNSSSLPVEIIPFKGGVLEALRSGGQGWLNIRKACEAMGIDAKAQLKRVQRNKWATGAIMTPVGTAADGKQREMVCLRIDRVAMWLATLEASRIKDPKVRAQVEVFQSDAADALDRWFRGGNGGSSGSGAAVHLVPAHIPHDLARPLDALELTLKAMRQIEADTAAVRVRVDAQDETLAKLGTDVAAVKEFIEHAPLKEPAPPKVIVRYPSADFAIDPERSQKLLEAIAKYGPSANRRTLAERLGIPYGSLTVLFASLIGRGLVVATGYRPYQHHLTPEGLKLLGSDLVIVDRGSAKPKQSAPHAKTKEAKTVPQPQLKLVMPPAPPAPNVPKPTIACGNGTLARVQFRNHMQIIGGCLRWTEQKYQEAYNAIYARMADLGHDPRGKTEMDPKTKKIKKIAPIEYLDRMGWASEAYEISLADYPMSMLAEVAVPRPSDIACHSEVR